MTRVPQNRGRTTPARKSGTDAPTTAPATGRVTVPPVVNDTIEPLYKRRPAVFAFVMLAVAAMVLTGMAGFFAILFS